MSLHRNISLLAVPLKSGVQVRPDSERGKWLMRVLHEAIKLMVKSLPKCELREFLVKNKELAERRRVPLLVSYCCGISETNNPSAM